MKTLMKISFSMTMVALSFTLKAQQISIYNHFYQLPQIQNTAYFGYDSVTTASLLYRNQWSGINGSPESQLLTIEGRLPLDGAGIGLNIENQSFNILGKTSLYLGSAYGVKLAPDHQLRFGLAVGMMQHRVDFFKVQNADANDPALLQFASRRTIIDANGSMLYAYKDLIEIGFTAMQMFGNTADFVNEGDEEYSSYKQLQHYYVSGKFYLPSTWYFDWELLTGYRAIQGTTTSWELGVKMDWQKKIQSTFIYRDKIGGILGIGLDMTKNMTFGYMFEFPTTGFGVLNTNGTHEVALSYLF